ncbi:hypothetical protein CERZMDRAFT_84874 [Cercospora zeae-maydis SCOH1-5]|uniref:Uncharacterized protein n=1 Tax=Cercospora zeae-maydis SCOH1-5 TaxID=717836 RepID=A0A6A6FEV1_9PEZI|nr:hypothetical protein CERZMDRAFT_84874 [Cercospora zeae-maydis SCOH1-5]
MQLSAGFFRLPRAIRTTIYTYVFGSGTIHVSSRECTSADRWMPCYSGLSDDLAGDNGRGLNSANLLCNKPGKSRSQTGFRKITKNDITQAGGPSSTSSLARILPYDTLRSASKEFPEWCQKSQMKQPKQSGPSRAGNAARLYDDTALHLSLLQVCRIIYIEALKLPYQQYTFDFIRCHTAEEFAGRMLTRRQAEFVRSVHVVHVMDLRDLLKLQRSFPHLRCLKVSSHRPLFFNNADPQDANAFFNGNALEKVELVRETLSASHLSHGIQEAFDFTEQMLLCKSLSAAQTLVFGWGNIREAFGGRVDWLADDELLNKSLTTGDSESITTSKIPLLRHARDLVRGYTSEHELEINRLKAELADARREISELRGASELQTLHVTAAAETPGPSPISGLPAELLARSSRFCRRAQT